MFIETPHLRLLPAAPQHLLALTEGVQQFEKQSGLPAAEGFGDFMTSGEVSPDWLAGLRTATVADPWVYGFVIVDAESGEVIGTCGFKGPPDAAGVVEIAYGIVPSFEGRGYATEAAQALVDFARHHREVRAVRAHTLPDNRASVRVLEKCGFLHMGEVMDPDDGLVWRFERRF
jgi:RimJ/RimL family protein N-acetyltransferase